MMFRRVALWLFDKVVFADSQSTKEKAHPRAVAGDGMGLGGHAAP